MRWLKGDIKPLSNFPLRTLWLWIAMGVAVIVISRSCEAAQPSSAERGERLAREYVSIPVDALDGKYSYFTLTQGRNVYMRLEMSPEQFDTLLASTCFSDGEFLASEHNPFQWEPDFSVGAPEEWWKPLENDGAASGTCEAQDANFVISHYRVEARFVVYLYIGT